MKHLGKIVFFFSLALSFICVGFSSKSTQHKDLAKTGLGSLHSYSSQHYSEDPQHKSIEIRHRSPREVEEIAVPSPNEKLLFSFYYLESAPQYFSKWTTYFHFEVERLPNDQAIPSSFSLRAPPFSC